MRKQDHDKMDSGRPSTGDVLRPVTHPFLALQKTAGNRATTLVAQRMAVTAKNLGAGPLQVDTGGDFDANHTAASWTDALARSANRASLIKTNTVVKDVAAFKAQVGAVDFDSGFVSNGKFRDLRVPAVGLWQIDTKAAETAIAQRKLPVEPPTQSRTVDAKNGMAAADGKEKSPGAYTRSANGPVFLVTGIRNVL